MDGLQIVFREQVKGAKHLIVFNVKGASSLKVTPKGKGGGRLDAELLGGTDLAELFVVLLGRDSRGPSGSAVVGVRVRVKLSVVVGTVVEELRSHGGMGGADVWWADEGELAGGVVVGVTTTWSVDKGAFREGGVGVGVGEMADEGQEVGCGM